MTPSGYEIKALPPLFIKEVAPGLNHSKSTTFPMEVSLVCISVSNHVTGFCDILKLAVGSGVTSTIPINSPVYKQP